MGYCLLYESMLETIIDARDRFLKPDGLVLPNKFEMFIAGTQDFQGMKRNK